MLPRVVTFRSTLRRTRKSHCHCFLPHSPLAAVPSRHSDVWTFRRSDDPKSFPLNSFADPHPLTPVPSILYKKHGGGAKPFRCALCIPNTGRPSVPFHLPYLLPSSVSRKSFVCHSYENTRGVGVFFPLWNSTKPHSDVRTCRSLDVPQGPLQPTAFGATIRKGTRFLYVMGKQLSLARCLRIRERISGTVPHRSRSQTPIRSELQVVPRFNVLMLNRSAGWLALQRRVGKAGSVRLG